MNVRPFTLLLAVLVGSLFFGCARGPDLGERLRGTWTGRETGVPYTLGDGRMIHGPSGSLYAEYSIIDSQTIRLQHAAAPGSPAFDTMLTVEFDGDRMDWVREADGEPIFGFTRAAAP